MNDDIAKRMVERLCLTPPFARLPVTNRPMEDLWLRSRSGTHGPASAAVFPPLGQKLAQAGGL